MTSGHAAGPAIRLARNLKLLPESYLFGLSHVLSHSCASGVHEWPIQSPRMDAVLPLCGHGQDSAAGVRDCGTGGLDLGSNDSKLESIRKAFRKPVSLDHSSHLSHRASVGLPGNLLGRCPAGPLEHRREARAANLSGGIYFVRRRGAGFRIAIGCARRC